MGKYSAMFSLGLKNALEYRGALFTWILVELMTLTSALFLWTGVYRTNSQVGSYNHREMILYYLLVPIVGALTTVHFSERIPRRIKDGDISKELIKPYSFLLSFAVNQLAIKIIQNTIKFPVYLVVGALLFWQYQLNLELRNLLLGLGAAIIGYLVHTVFDLALSLIAFWFDDSWSLSLLKHVVLMIFGGLLFPLDLIPSAWRAVFRLLPFDLIYYFPVSLIMGKLSSGQIGFYLIKAIIWMVIFYSLIIVMWSKGTRKYCAYGQ